MQPACHGRFDRQLGGFRGGRPGQAAQFLQQDSRRQARIDAAQGAMQEDCPPGGGDSALLPPSHELDAIR
jgi:hypothetical protein